jgi:outer membrane receptor protein involved in Fe transport
MSTRKREIRMTLLATTAALPLSVVWAVPQDQEADGLAEVTVTARKSAERLQDVPISVEAFTAERLEQIGARNVFDVVALTPNLVIEQRSTRDDRPAIRGIGNTDIDPTKRVVSFFVDGAPVLGAISRLPLGDIERVEVLRGPQSAQFGRATFAGAINYVLKKPTDELRASIEAEVAEFSSYRAALNVSGPIQQAVLGFRFGASVSEYGGEHINVFSGRRYGAEENRSASAGLVFTPSENFDAQVSFLYSLDDNAPPAYGQFPFRYKQCLTGLNPGRRPGFDSNGWVCGELEARDLVINQSDDAYVDGPGYRQQTRIGLAQFGWRFADGHELRLVSSLTGQDSDARDNQSRVPVSVFDIVGGVNTRGAQAIDLWSFDLDSHELRYMSPIERPWRFMLGVSRTTEEFVISRIQGAQLTNYPDTDEYENRSIYGSVAWDPTDWLTVSVEARRQKDEVLRIDTTAGNQRRAEVEFTSTLPRAIVEWKPRDGLMFYGSYAEGERPGATALTTGITGQPLLPEEQKTFELGARSSWLGGRLTANVSVFDTEWSKIFGLYAFFTDPNNPATLTSVRRNQGDADIRGLELQLAARPVDGLTLQVSYGLTDAAYKRGYITPESEALLGTAGAIDFIDGNRPRYIPKHTGALQINWRAPLVDDWQYTLNSTVSYVGKRYATELNTDYYGASTIANLSAGIDRGNLSFELFGRNVFDDDTIVASGRFQYLAFGDPRRNTLTSANYIAEGTLPRGRQWGLRARYRF